MCVPIAVMTGGLISGCMTGGLHARSNLVLSLLPMYGVIVWNFRYDVRRRYRQFKKLIKKAHEAIAMGTSPPESL
jgi:hypothetical protein